eukprot:787719-Amphidinium_carterae.2
MQHTEHTQQEICKCAELQQEAQDACDDLTEVHSSQTSMRHPGQYCYLFDRLLACIVIARKVFINSPKVKLQL